MIPVLCPLAELNLQRCTVAPLPAIPHVRGRLERWVALVRVRPETVLSTQIYGLPTDGSADYQDTDGTGMNNWQKWVAGLNPTNSASALIMLNPTNASAPGGVTVSWQSVNTRNYYLRRSTNMNGQPVFLTIQSNIAGKTGATGFDRSATNGGPYFNRVGVQ